ncbi:DUF262 domain-containing protein [Promicromonospora sp. CA-289599]|jgi:hypothetical protein|uniref:DUF262 domain-containing protein n=1 Tax=Promicromonospora sp. CA-289599 TaxID=3240014 RepID=UPI003D8B2FBB
MSKSIDASEIQLGRLFSEDFEFHIPDYQRPYAWGREQSLQLLDDLTAALERDTDEPYFLGSVVLIQADGGPIAEVVDGQQRLTTLTILLAVMRDLVTEPELSRDIHKLVEEPAVGWADKPARPRLRLREKDAAFFRKYIQTIDATTTLVDLSDQSVTTDAQRAIRDNARALSEVLVKWPSDRVQDLFKTLGARTFLVTVSTPDLNSAYRIFSVMNARGLPLTPPDIFKARVVGAIPSDEERAEYAKTWEDLEEELGRDEFGDLFLYLRLIVSKTRVERSLLIEFPEQVLKPYLPAKGKQFVDDVLEPFATADQRLVNRDFDAIGPWAKVNTWLDRLSQIDNDDWRPVALWALKSHKDDGDFLAAFLKRLERLAASFLLRRVYTTPRQARYLDLLRQLDDGAGLAAPAFELTDDEKAETRARLDGEIYLVKPVRKYVLLRLDSMIAQDPGASYSHKIITVEHVLPQNPKPESIWARGFSDDDRARWTHRLGNLVLLNRTKNSEAQNFDFVLKKEKYFKSGRGAAIFALTLQVLNHPTWTPTELEERQKKLVALLVAEWQL